MSLFVAGSVNASPSNKNGGCLTGLKTSRRRFIDPRLFKTRLIHHSFRGMLDQLSMVSLSVLLKRDSKYTWLCHHSRYLLMSGPRPSRIISCVHFPCATGSNSVLEYEQTCLNMTGSPVIV